MRFGAVAARGPHKPKVVSSSLTTATTFAARRRSCREVSKTSSSEFESQVRCQSAVLAKLVKAPASQAGNQGFESPRRYQASVAQLVVASA